MPTDSSCRRAGQGVEHVGAAPHPGYPAGIVHCRRCSLNRRGQYRPKDQCGAKARMGAAGHSVCPALDAKCSYRRTGPGGVGEWQQEGLPLWWTGGRSCWAGQT